MKLKIVCISMLLLLPFFIHLVSSLDITFLEGEGSSSCSVCGLDQEDNSCSYSTIVYSTLQYQGGWKTRGYHLKNISTYSISCDATLRDMQDALLLIVDSDYSYRLTFEAVKPSRRLKTIMGRSYPSSSKRALFSTLADEHPELQAVELLRSSNQLVRYLIPGKVVNVYMGFAVGVTDIGVFGYYSDSIGSQFLRSISALTPPVSINHDDHNRTRTDNKDIDSVSHRNSTSLATPQDVRGITASLLPPLSTSGDSQYLYIPSTSLTTSQITTLRRYLETAHITAVTSTQDNDDNGSDSSSSNSNISSSSSSSSLSDFKVYLSMTELEGLVGSQACSALTKLFGGRVDEVILRRSSAVGQHINFHVDVSERTMQVALNCQDEYVGGRVVYCVGDKLSVPARRAGSAVVHRNDIVHGVSELEAGVRYGLFFLQKYPFRSK